MSSQILLLLFRCSSSSSSPLSSSWPSSQLRYLQTLNSISAENNSTIIFPIPIDIISQLCTAKQTPRKVRFLLVSEDLLYCLRLARTWAGILSQSFFSSTKLWITRFSSWVDMPSALGLVSTFNLEDLSRTICS